MQVQLLLPGAEAAEPGDLRLRRVEQEVFGEDLGYHLCTQPTRPIQAPPAWWQDTPENQSRVEIGVQSVQDIKML